MSASHRCTCTVSCPLHLAAPGLLAAAKSALAALRLTDKTPNVDELAAQRARDAAWDALTAAIAHAAPPEQP